MWYGLDWTISITESCARVSNQVTFQRNLDSVILLFYYSIKDDAFT